MKNFFRPSSVAVIGASADPDKLGHAVLKNLVDGGYIRYGSVYPINPRAKEILGIEVYPSVLDVPDPIELAVIVVPYPHVPEVVRDCGQKGVPAAIVITAGFREAGEQGLERERELIAIVREYNIRLIGPNCLGIIDTYTPLNASFSTGTPPQGPMAFISQSGALGTAILDWAQAGKLGLSKFISLGNKADVNEIDLMKDLADDEHTRVILLYIEELSNGEEFMGVAREIALIKPIVAIKSGVTQAGARAVSSHTGSLAGFEQAYQAAFHQAGVLRAESMETLFDMALAFGYQPPLMGRQIAVITNAGGPAILATDALERAGLGLAQFKMETTVALKESLPAAASVINPVDVLGDARADRYHMALETVAADPGVDGMLVIMTPQAMTEIDPTARAISALAKQTEKPILACLMGESRMASGIEILTKDGIPNYPFPERAARAFRGMAEYRSILDRPRAEYVKFEINPEPVQAVLEQARMEGRVTIGDAEARTILDAYGISIPRSEIAETADRAAGIAKQIGYPVALKIASPDILHKTDIGGVMVGLSGPQEVKDAFELITYRAQRYVPQAQLWGCLVQEMIPPDGVEVLIGMNRDPQFGPLVTFGLGGIYVEILKDVTFRIAPLSVQDAEAMLEEIRARALLDGVRGRPAVDKAAIVDILLRIGQLVQDFPEIVELDINPLAVHPEGQGATALDMRMVLKSQTDIGAEK